MNPDRAIAAILTISVAGVLLLGVYLLTSARRIAESTSATPAAVAEAPSPVPSPTGTMAPAPAVVGYRLAGTVVGDLAYAIIESPDGTNQLYRPGQMVPGLGEVQSVEADRIVVAGGEGLLTLSLAAAPTGTATRARPRPTDVPPLQAATPARSPRARSATESSP